MSQRHADKAGGDGFAKDQAWQGGPWHFGGKECASADGLDQQKASPGRAPDLGDGAGGKASDGEADRQLVPCCGMAADDIGPGGAENVGGGVEDLGQVRDCNVSDRRGRVICASAACGAAPMAQMSPRA